MLGTLTSGAQVSKKRKDEIIETSLSVIHQLSMRDDPTTHPDSIELFKSTTLELIGQAMLRGEDITEDEAKQGLQYLDDSRKISKAFGAVGNANTTEILIANFRAICIQKFGAQEAFGKPETDEQVLERHRNAHQMTVEKQGEVTSLIQGANLATELMILHHTIIETSKSSMASCWICLDDEADRCGKPPVRDCSCRGDDAGFIHRSCLVEYARRKSSEAVRPDGFISPWMNCPSCKKSYQNQLLIDLSDEFKRFIDEKYPEFDWRHLALQRVMLATQALASSAQRSKERLDEIIETSLSVINQLPMPLDLTIHHSVEALKAAALELMGILTLREEDLTEDEAKKGLKYLDDSRKMSGAIGAVEDIIKLESLIANFKVCAFRSFGLKSHLAYRKRRSKSLRDAELLIRCQLKSMEMVSPLLSRVQV
jgi:hypothetical protein